MDEQVNWGALLPKGNPLLKSCRNALVITRVVLKISSEVLFLCGESMAIEGEIVWEKNGEFGVLFNRLISADTMENEKKYVILKHPT